MARIRSVKPGFNKSPDIAPTLSIPCRLHFVMLWTYADDEGRGLDDTMNLKGELWQRDRDVTEEVIEEWQAELARAGRIVRYEVDGRRYFEVHNFRAHQKPNRPQESTIPAANSQRAVLFTERSVNDQCADTEQAVTEQGTLTAVVEGRGEVVGGERNIAPATPPRQDLLFDALCEVCGLNPKELTASARGALNKACKDLREVDASPAGVRMRAANFRSRWPDITLTPSALAKQWAACATAAGPTGKAARNQSAVDNVLGALRTEQVIDVKAVGQ